MISDDSTTTVSDMMTTFAAKRRSGRIITILPEYGTHQWETNSFEALKTKGKVTKASIVDLVFLLRLTAVEGSYNDESCAHNWDCVVAKLLSPWLSKNRFIDRAELSNMNVSKFAHTPLLLRVVKGKLHCVQHPRFRKIKNNLRIKAYRALHYIHRLNRILKNNRNAIPDATEWWTHQGDLVKIPLVDDSLPIFSFGGSKGYADIAGIPAAALSDKMGRREERAFLDIQKIPWEKRLSVAFFRGSLSDCFVAKEKFGGNINFCVRAKLILEADRSKLAVLKDIGASSSFKNAGFNVKCSSCEKGSMSSSDFVKNIYSHKYLLNLPGVGQSRRMAQLLRSGGTIFQSENKGYQFYDYALEPGFHYIPFEAQPGIPGLGNLVSRLNWAMENDDAVKKIASRSKSYADNCLTEQSIDYFATAILKGYSSILIGNSSNLPLVDLSECFAEREGQSISRLCKGVIQRCWFLS
ncbi:unnamed protein product [Bathycoccus prasinos]